MLRDVEMDHMDTEESDTELAPFIDKDQSEYHISIADDVAIEQIMKSHPLPPRNTLLQLTRWTIFGVYRRIFLMVFIGNIWWGHRIITMRRRSKYSPLLVDMSTVASFNMLVAVLIRQDYILNILFRSCGLLPFLTPLRIRRSLAKVYEYGGLHSGAATCSVIWFTMTAALLFHEYTTIRIADPWIIICSFIVAGMLWSVAISAYPVIRAKQHNTFEVIHRFGGWICLATFLPELYLFTRAIGHQSGPDSYGASLKRLPAFWMWAITTFHVALPWMRLRRLPVQPERLGVGVHAIRLHLPEQVTSCVTYRIADAPLKEWHSFACIPAPNSEKGSSMIVSNAGDWTRRAINNPKKWYYTRGVPTVGVLCMAKLFRRVVIVTTGSGIGPCLGTISSIPQTKCRVLWSAPEPRHTFGDEICDAVLKVDEQAVVIDTHKVGRKDLVKLSWALYQEEKAEAVFIVSNKHVTKWVVYELESRGVPAFGPIWDS